jgi:hypothetical protein
MDMESDAALVTSIIDRRLLWVLQEIGEQGDGEGRARCGGGSVHNEPAQVDLHLQVLSSASNSN